MAGAGACTKRLGEGCREHGDAEPLRSYMPMMEIVKLQQQHHLLAGSPFVKSLPGAPEDIDLDGDGLDDSDILR